MLSISTYLGLSLWCYIQFIGIHVPSFSCVGTPAQLRSFLQSVRNGIIIPRHKARVCFDLDRALLIVHPRPSPDAGRTDSIQIVKQNFRLLQVRQDVQARSSRKPRHVYCMAHLSEGIRIFFPLYNFEYNLVDNRTRNKWRISRLFKRPHFALLLTFPCYRN